MDVKELQDECLWFSKTHGPDLNISVFDKTLGAMEPTGLGTAVLEYAGRRLCFFTDVVNQGGFTDQLANALFDVIKSSEVNRILEKQLQEDFGNVIFRDRLSATMVGVITSDEFQKVLKENLKL